MNSLIQLKLVLRKRISSLLVLPLMLCVSCEKYEDIAGYKEYLIKEGKHGAEDTGGGEMTDHALVYDIIFDSTCVYEIASEDQADINKLFGFSDCNDLHHANSARFGWRWYQNELQILSYTYNNDVVSYQELGAVEFDKSYRYIIYINEDSYEFYIEGIMNETVSVDRGNTCDAGYYYFLWPYFGGNQTAPHDMKIFMRRIYDWYR